MLNKHNSDAIEGGKVKHWIVGCVALAKLGRLRFKHMYRDERAGEGEER